MKVSKAAVLCQLVALCTVLVCGALLVPARGIAQTSDKSTAEKATKHKRSKKSTDAASTGHASRAQDKAESKTATPVKNASDTEIQAAKSSGKVWVNTDSGVYHKSGKWFGATKQGKFMTEQDAIKAGYRAAKNEK